MSEESLNEKSKRLFKTTQDTIEKIRNAWEEKVLNFNNWECINEGILDFNSIEKDITKIQDEMKQDNVVILGTQVTINRANKFIEIKTYTQEGDKFFGYPSKGEFKSLDNLPTDIEAELKNKESVTIQISLSYKEEIKESDIPQEQLDLMKKYSL